MEKLNVGNIDGDANQAPDSDSDFLLSENELLFGFLNPHPYGAGYPTGAPDQVEGSQASSHKEATSKHLQKCNQKTMKMNSKLKKTLNGFLAPNASSTTQNGHSNRRDHDSPYRRFVVTTELRSDPKQHSKFVRYVIIDSYFLLLGTAGGKRGFLRGGFTLVGVGGLQTGTHLGGN